MSNQFSSPHYVRSQAYLPTAFSTSSWQAPMTEWRDTGMEEMDWSDSCLETSHTSVLSPALLSSVRQPMKPSGTSPTTLLSSLNISDSLRPRFDAVEQIPSPINLPSLRTETNPYPFFPQRLGMSGLQSSAEARLSPLKTKRPFPSSHFPTFRRSLSGEGRSSSAPAQTETIPVLAGSPEVKNEISNPDEEEDECNETVESDEDKTKGDENKPDINTHHMKPRKRKCACIFRVSLFMSVAVLTLLCSIFLSSLYTKERGSVQDIDLSLLNRELNDKVFGQHLAVKIVTESLKSFVEDTGNLLVLSFQGWTGIGKNHMSNILSRFVPSANVHRFIVTLHFTKNLEQQDMENWMMSKVTSNGGIHLVILDEMDKASDEMVRGLAKALRSARKHLAASNDAKVVVLLLSNTGSATINSYTAQVLHQGLTREDLSYDDLVSRLQTSLQDAWYGEMLEEKLIDGIVPFLPLEKIHVERCIVVALRLRNVDRDDNIIRSVLDRLAFFPPSSAIFSTTGCRKVNSELDLLLY